VETRACGETSFLEAPIYSHLTPLFFIYEK
jgi:hypothetical protein